MNRVFSGLAIVGRTFAKRYNVVRSTQTILTPRSFSSSSPFVNQTPEQFLDNENVNAHNAMVNDPFYRETVIDPYNREDLPVVTDKQFHALINKEFDSMTPDEICDDFRHVTSYIMGKDYDLLNAMFDKLRNRLLAALSNLTDEQLMSTFKLLSLWNVRFAKSPVFYKLWSEFDRQCVERHKKWSLNKLLLFMDHWYIVKLSRFSNFVWLGVRKLARKPSRLTPKQLVQMMFYANTSRKFLPTLPMYDIEQEIYACYDDFNIKELGIVSLGFFKTQTPIRNQHLIKKMYNSVISEITNINSIDLAAFLKIFRYCTKHQNADSMYQLMDKLIDRVYNVQLVCCMHMALLGTNLLIKHEELLKKISQRIVNEISNSRIKDIERITLALTMLNYDPQTTPCIFKTIVNELQSDKRNIDFEVHTKCYIFTLSYLAVINIYPYDCISKALKTETLHKCFGKKLSRFTIPRDIVSLNNSLLIECPDYSGPLLARDLNVSCNNHIAWHIPIKTEITKENVNEGKFVRLYDNILQIFKNESYLHVCYPLPHHPKADILFCIDTEGKLVTIPKTIKSKIAFSDFQKPPELGKWYAIMCLVRNSVLYYSNVNNGLTQCKIRQLKKLGYEPILFTSGEMEDINSKLILDKFSSHGITLN